MDLVDATDLFTTDLAGESRAAWTTKKHRQELRRYGHWLDQEALDWRHADLATLRRFIRTRSGLSASARGGTNCTLRVFYRWAAEQGEVERSPAAALPTPRRPHPQPKALTIGQVRTLTSYLAGRMGYAARRDEALLITAIYAGLRAAELASRVWADIDLDAPILTIRLSKANHGRALPLHADHVRVLRAWRALQGGGDADPVFNNVRHKRCITAISPNAVNKIAHDVSAGCGVTFTPHTLRHTFATWTLRKSKDLYAVSKALGHLDLKQTAIYLSADTEQIAAAIGALPNLGEW